MNKQTIIKLISLVSLLISMGLSLCSEALSDEWFKYFWPLHIVAMVLFVAMLWGLKQDRRSLATSLEPYLPKQRLIRFIARELAATVMLIPCFFILSSPMFYLLPWARLGAIPPFEGDVFKGFLFLWLLFLTISFLYFWLVKPVMQLMMSRLNQGSERL